jgi:hypothetical protein
MTAGNSIDFGDTEITHPDLLNSIDYTEVSKNFPPIKTANQNRRARMLESINIKPGEIRLPPKLKALRYSSVHEEKNKDPETVQSLFSSKKMSTFDNKFNSSIAPSGNGAIRYTHSPTKLII